MGMEIFSRVLPGIGTVQELTLHDGRRLGIVARRNGMYDIVIYDEADADSSLASITLTDDEADAVAELLGAPTLVMRLAGLQSQADDVLTEQLPIPLRSPFAGRPLGDTQARTRTGASIVAILRSGRTIPSPGPDFVLAANDLVVTVGTRSGLDAVARILETDDGTG